MLSVRQVGHELDAANAGQVFDGGRILRRGPTTLDPAVYFLRREIQTASKLGLRGRRKPLDCFVDGGHADI